MKTCSIYMGALGRVSDSFHWSHTTSVKCTTLIKRFFTLACSLVLTLTPNTDLMLIIANLNPIQKHFVASIGLLSYMSATLYLKFPSHYPQASPDMKT